METTLSGDAVEEVTLEEVTLDDGTTQKISDLSGDELLGLQWDQERAFARRILDAPKGSGERIEATRRAYTTVNKIVGARMAKASGDTLGGPVTLGLEDRYRRLVVNLLWRWRARESQPAFFEIGYGSGALLKHVSDQGFPVGGIEVSAAMREQARRLLGPGHEQALQLGDFLGSQWTPPQPGCHLVYWNDVFEHVPPDEILDYLCKIHDLLVPGGQLITISPNWHERPSDVTGDVCPPRTEAAGLHLKEYTLREATGLLRRARFVRVAGPLVVTPGRTILWGDGLAGLKRFFEPALERLPFRLARLLCHGLGLCYTIATKGTGDR